MVHLHQLPESFKSGFVRAFYGISLLYGSSLRVSGVQNSGLRYQDDLDWLLFCIGFEVGGQEACKASGSARVEHSATPSVHDAWIGTWVLGSSGESRAAFAICPSVTN
jgi:hypothetical protein